MNKNLLQRTDSSLRETSCKRFLFIYRKGRFRFAKLVTEGVFSFIEVVTYAKLVTEGFCSFIGRVNFAKLVTKGFYSFIGRVNLASRNKLQKVIIFPVCCICLRKSVLFGYKNEYLPEMCIFVFNNQSLVCYKSDTGI